MRFACVALVFSLFVLQKDPNEEPPLHYKPWPGRLCWEQSGLQRLRNTFSWQPDFCWVAESPWGSWLLGVAMVLLCAFLEGWATSCLTSLQTQPAGSAVCLERSPSCAKVHSQEPQGSETSSETDLEIPQRKCSLHLWRQPSVSSSESYEPPSEKQRHSFATYESTGKRRQEKVLYPEYKRSRSSSSSPQHSPQDQSSSPSSSPPSSSFCLARLKNVGFLRASRDSSSAKWEARSQSSQSEGKRFDSYYAPSDPSLSEEEGQVKRKPSPNLQPEPCGTMFLLEKCSETESFSLSLQPKEAQTQTSFAKINIVQSTAYKKEDGVLFVEKSLQIQMGDVHLPRPRMPFPKLILPDDVRKRRKSETLSMLVLPSVPHARTSKGKHVVSLCRLLGTLEKATPKGSSQSRERPGLNAIFARVSSPDGFVRVPSIMEKVDEDTKKLLEFHIQKKMVQWKCGMPSVVVKSVAAFQSLPSLCQDKPASGSPMPTETITLTPRKHVSLALRISPCVVLCIRSPQGAQGPRETSVLSSRKPEDSHRLAFHAAVKMLEIKMGAFPEMVGSSFQLFRNLSKKPFPKTITSGNKILRSKPPLLPFLTQENVCILELNIKRKWLAYARNVSIVYTKLTATVVATTISSRLRESEEEPRERMAQLLVSIWRQIQMVAIASCGLNHRLPLPLQLESSASSALSAEGSPEGQFQAALLKKLVAVQVPAETLRSMEEQLLVKGRGESDQEKPPEAGPGQRALPFSLSFDQPDPRSTASRKAMKFRAETSIVRSSIFLELEIKKEKLNLHLKKRMRAQLRPAQGIGLEVTVGPRRKAGASPAPQQSRSSTQAPGRPHRSFCYVCMPSDESGTEFKTVCWSLPKWILEMNGYRTPEVARFASRSRTQK